MEENNEIKGDMEDFIDFASEPNAVVKPVVIDGELIGWIVWSGGHTLNFFNADYEETDIRNIGDFASDSVPFETFLKEANDWINEIRQELNNEEGEAPSSDNTG